MVTRWLGAAHLVVERHHAAVFPVREAEGGQQHAADVGLGDRAVNVRHHDPGRAAHQVQAGGRPHHAAGARLHPAHLAPVHCTCILYCTHLYTSWFCPGWRPSCASCAAVAVVVRCLGSGSLIPSSADQNLACVQSLKCSTDVIISHKLHLYWPDPSSRARVEKYPRPALSSTMLTGTSRLLTWRLTTCPDRGSQMSFLPGQRRQHCHCHCCVWLTELYTEWRGGELTSLILHSQDVICS